MHQNREREDEGPVQGADGSALKDEIGRREIGEQQLHDYQDGYPGEDPLIGEHADTKNRMLQIFKRKRGRNRLLSSPRACKLRRRFSPLLLNLSATADLWLLYGPSI